jgi:DNA-binding MarR family transcriptional regulator
MAKERAKIGGIVPDSSRLQELYRRPGFMIRRCHQIAVAIFADESRALDLTTTQYGILYVLNRHPGLDQISLARLLGLDRSTTGMVLARLEERALLRRTVDASDKRKRLLALTSAGEKLLVSAQPVVRRAQERLMAPFALEERQVLIGLLDRLIEIDGPQDKTGAARTLTEEPRTGQNRGGKLCDGS